MEIKALISRYPRLFHMAERGTWTQIKKHGLLSTSAVLDFHSVKGKLRKQLETEHRPNKVTVGTSSQMVLRDQKPMAPDRLARALQDQITPQEWYKLLNGKVFMWAQEERLLGLLGARQYRTWEHDVLTIDTSSLFEKHARAVWLCAMNSGNTFPMPHARGKDTFQRIADYPVKRNGSPAKEVVEVLVDYSVPDIGDHVIQVRRMRGDVTLEALKI